MTIDTAYRTLQYFTDKFQSGAFGPLEFNLAAEFINTDLFKLKVGLPEEYDKQQPWARQGWQVTQKITDDCRHLVVPKDIMISPDGYFKLPADYGAYSSLRYGFVKNNHCGQNASVFWKKVEVVTDGELNERLDSALLPPTIKRPIAGYYQLGIKVFPDAIESVRLTYLRFPNKPLRNYTMNNGQDVYNPTGSVEFDWPETLHNDILIRMAKYVGLNLREELIINFANDVQNKGG